MVAVLAEQFGPRAIFGVMAAMTVVAVLLLPLVDRLPELVAADLEREASTVARPSA